MGRYIVKLDDYYLEWSTAVDAPMTWGMSLDAFKEYYLDEYGNSGMQGLPVRLRRVDENGLSSCLDYFDIDYNRAGENESCLSRDEIIELYCVKRENPQWLKISKEDES